MPERRIAGATSRWRPAWCRTVFTRRVLSVVQKGRKQEDVFPTRYRLNTARAIRRAFEPSGFQTHVYTINGEPSYVGGSWVLAWHVKQAFRVLPERFGTFLLIFLRKT